MKKILSLLLALVMVLSLAACGGEKNDPTTEPTDAPTSAPTTEPTQAPTTEPTEEPTEEPTTEPAGEKALSSFSLSVLENFTPVNTLFISDNGDGTVFVEYMGEVHKMSFDFGGAALTEIANALATLDLTTLGEGGYEEEVTKSCSLYVGYTDGTMVMYDYAGTEIPAAFTAILTAMDAAFQTALADLEVYVPQLQIMGELDANLQTEMLEIMNNSGIANLDSLYAQPIALDEYFGFSAGLTSADGIANAAICQGMMSTPYSLVIVTLAEGTDAAAVAADFETNLDLAKWVCVRADTAMIAQKGDMVLCLMGADTMYTGTADAIQNAGWTVIKTITE